MAMADEEVKDVDVYDDDDDEGVRQARAIQDFIEALVTARVPTRDPRRHLRSHPTNDSYDKTSLSSLPSQASGVTDADIKSCPPEGFSSEQLSNLYPTMDVMMAHACSSPSIESFRLRNEEVIRIWMSRARSAHLSQPLGSRDHPPTSCNEN